MSDFRYVPFTHLQNNNNLNRMSYEKDFYIIDAAVVGGSVFTVFNDNP